jgi:hypothetical protein
MLGFNEQGLNVVVRIIGEESESLLEIVNYNVEGEQYVCAGTVSTIITSIPTTLLTHHQDAKPTHPLNSHEPHGQKP